MITKLYRRLIPSKIREFVYDAFLGYLLKEIRFKRIISLLIKSKIDNVPEKESYIKYAKRHFFRLSRLELIFPNPFAKKYVKMDPPVYYDEKISLHYTLINGKRLYWKQNMSTKLIKRDFSRLMAEQDKMSAHKYFDDDFSFTDKILFDIGAAEGIIVLNHIDEIRHAYLFECDEEWNVALLNTFKSYMDKITIVSKYVSDCSNDTCTTIDDFVGQSGIVPDIIKMDIEGYEEKALIGAHNLLSNHNIYISCCIYHLPDAEEKIIKLLSSMQYHCEINPSYMFPYVFANTGAPYLRHGIVRAYHDFGN